MLEKTDRGVFMDYIKNIFVFLFSCIIIISCSDSPSDPGNQDVQLFFKYNYRDELNTFDNTYQKDLVQDGVIKVKFSLTREEHEQIVQKAEEVGFFSLPDTLNIIAEDSIVIRVDPEFSEELRIKTSNEDNKVAWRTSIFFNGDYYDKFSELRLLIINIIEARSEYKKLPPIKGGYM
jgi:hypothetical protein